MNGTLVARSGVKISSRVMAVSSYQARQYPLRIQLVKFSVFLRDLSPPTPTIIASPNLRVYVYNSVKEFDSI